MATEKRMNPLKVTMLGLLALGCLFTVSLDAGEEKSDKAVAFLGVSVNALERHEKENLGVKWGVRVAVVERKSAADQAGIEVDDIILTFDGEKVRRSFDLIEMVGEHKPGDLVNLELLRDKQKKSVQVALGKRSDKRFFPLDRPGEGRWKMVAPEMEKFVKRPFLGVFIEEIEGDFAEYFGVKEKTAVLIRSLEKEGPAAKGGLKAGDVLLQVADNKIEKAGDVMKALHEMKAGDKVDITVMRHGKSLKLNLVLGEREEPRMFRFFRGDENLPFQMMEFGFPGNRMRGRGECEVSLPMNRMRMPGMDMMERQQQGEPNKDVPRPGPGFMVI